jgi:hypothetical protein
MGLQVIELALEDTNPFFLPNQYTLCQGVWRQSDAAPMVAVTTDPLPGGETLAGSRAASSILRRRSIALGVCVLGLLFGAAGDKGLCSESNLRAQALVGSTEQGRTITKPYATGDRPFAVAQLDRETLVEQKQATERGRGQIDTQRFDALQGKVAPSAAARERKQVVEHGLEWGKAEALARALTSSLRGEVAALRSAAEAERIKQRDALDRERDRANALARELDSLKAELDGARRVSQKAAQASEAEVKQREALEQERDRADRLARQVTSLQAELDAARSASAKAAQVAEAEVKQREALVQERGRADSIARQVTSLQAELDAARSAGAKAAQAAEAEVKQREALEQERGRADTLARQVTSLQAELDAARSTGAKAAQAAEAEVKQRDALEQERGRADTLERQVTSLRAELDAARSEDAKAAQAAAGSEQKQALENELREQRDKAAALASELTSVRAELDKGHAANLAAAKATAAAKTEQQKERAHAESLARELDSAGKQAEERSALLAAAHAELLQTKGTTSANAKEQKLALASERDRADALGRDLNSVRNQLEAGNKQIAALNALLAQYSGKAATDRSQARIAEFSSTTIEEEERSKQQISRRAAASTSDSSAARPQAPSALPASELGQSPSASAGTHSPVDEQRLLARANALLQQADISGARPLLEHAVEHGSARAAYMLAETYDTRVLQAWRARGISGDPAKARQLYERAQAAGIEDAKGRIEALQ